MSPLRQPAAAAPTDPEALLPRFAALKLFEAALARRGGLEEAANAHAHLELSARDRAFARALAMAALRGLGPIDRRLRGLWRKPPPEAVINLLRLGAAQILHLDTPAFAAVATAVEMAEAKTGTRPFKGMVNAVLRAVARDPAPAPEAETFAPDWLYARWRAAYGEPLAQAIAARIAIEPETDLTLRDPKEAAALADALTATPLAGGGLRTPRRGEISTWPGFADGRWWVQDAAAAIPARLLAPAPGSAALDLCAAPGGKTLQLAAMGASVTALDRSAARLSRLSDNLRRTGLSAEIAAADALSWADERTFASVLLDAPCSATGTFRRHPDVLWAARATDVAKLAGAQRALLDAAAPRVGRGGRLVYCVCSLEPEEGEIQAAAFLERQPAFVLERARPGEAGAPAAALTALGALRLTPALAEPQGGVDGFFIARFQRRV